MKVDLTYFKPSGKYYGEGQYETKEPVLYKIWEEVDDMQRQRQLPGLIAGSHGWIISIDVPDHEHRHPRLRMPI